MVFNIKGAWDFMVFGKCPTTQYCLYWASLCTWEYS